MVEQGSFGTDYANDEWGESRANTESGGSNLSKFSLKDKETAQIRMLGKRKEAKIHWGAHASKKMIVCPKTDDPKAACPICDIAERTGNKDIKASWRCFINVIDRRDGVLKVWDFAPQTKQIIHSIIANRVDINKENPLTNYEIRVTRKGTGFDTTYEFQISSKPVALTPEDQALSGNMINLEEQYKSITPQELNKLFAGGGQTVQAPQKTTQAPAAQMPGVGGDVNANGAVEAGDDTFF